MGTCNLFNFSELIQNTVCRTQNKRKQNQRFKWAGFVFFLIIIHRIPVNDRQKQKHNWDKLKLNSSSLSFSPSSLPLQEDTCLLLPPLPLSGSSYSSVLVSPRPLSALLWFRARLSGKLKDKSRKLGFRRTQVEVITDCNYFSRSNGSI